jgi:kynureninase
LLAPSEYDGTVTTGYLDTATYGLPPRSTLAAVEEAARAWREGGSWLRWEEDGEACRELFARIIGAEPENVAYVGAASVAAGIVAASLKAGTGDNIVLYERDFDPCSSPGARSPSAAWSFAVFRSSASWTRSTTARRSPPSASFSPPTAVSPTSTG